MTKEEAIKNIKVANGIVYSEYAGINDNQLVNDVNEALDMAIDALDHEKEIIDALGLSIRVQSLKNSMLEEEKHKLNKIRAEIEDVAFDWQEIDGEHESFMVVDLNDTLRIIDKYRKESEEN